MLICNKLLLYFLYCICTFTKCSPDTLVFALLFLKKYTGINFGILLLHSFSQHLSSTSLGWALGISSLNNRSHLLTCSPTVTLNLPNYFPHWSLRLRLPKALRTRPKCFFWPQGSSWSGLYLSFQHHLEPHFPSLSVLQSRPCSFKSSRLPGILLPPGLWRCYLFCVQHPSITLHESTANHLSKFRSSTTSLANSQLTFLSGSIIPSMCSQHTLCLNDHIFNAKFIAVII